MLEDAIQMALDAHRGQVDKAGKPYILHPLRIALEQIDPKAQVAAILHDVVEDSDVTAADIEARFGLEIANAVDCLTKRDGESYDDFVERCGPNPIARAVKLGDLADNMDLSRIANPSAKDHARVEKYRKAKARLLEFE